MAKKMKIETNKKREKWNIFSSGDAFEKSALLGPRIELFFNNKIIVEGCLGVLEYNDNYLKLRLVKGALVLEGTEFDIVSFEEKTMVLNGKIIRMEFVV